jgi:hypothetical protein
VRQPAGGDKLDREGEPQVEGLIKISERRKAELDCECI